jgi:hypothetical protein
MHAAEVIYSDNLTTSSLSEIKLLYTGFNKLNIRLHKTKYQYNCL